ncbi:MAG: 50S ribosomal protein L6 [Pseudomonadota bacterium]|nr:50S ribosomal protein L6 [Pseudomonadota bacterium]
MSRIAKEPVKLPSGVKAELNDGRIVVSGSKGSLDLAIPNSIDLELGEDGIKVKTESTTQKAKALSGTIRALVQNLVTGVDAGFEYRLEIVGVGYRAQVQGKKLNLSLGFSHPIEFPIPEGVVIETPSQTEVIVKGVNKQLVGQAAADIRAFRPPEPYKGKGVRYEGEHIIRKEAKKA